VGHCSFVDASLQRCLNIPDGIEQIVGRGRRERVLIADFQLPIVDLNSHRGVNSAVGSGVSFRVTPTGRYIASDSQSTRLSCSTVKVRDVLKLLRNNGWSLITTVGSHRQLKHPTKSGRVTVSGHPSDDIHPKTLKSILTQAGLKK